MPSGCQICPRRLGAALRHKGGPALAVGQSQITCSFHDPTSFHIPSFSIGLPNRLGLPAPPEWRLGRPRPRRSRIVAAIQPESGPTRDVKHQHSGSVVRGRSRRPATGAASRARKNSLCNFHIAIGDEKTNVANLITRAADSSIGGAILR
jgi:hypothetical protein